MMVKMYVFTIALNQRTGQKILRHRRTNYCQKARQLNEKGFLLCDDVDALLEKLDERALVQDGGQELFEGDGPFDDLVAVVGLVVVQRQRRDVVRRKRRRRSRSKLLKNVFNNDGITFVKIRNILGRRKEKQQARAGIRPRSSCSQRDRSNHVTMAPQVKCHQMKNH